MMLVVLLLSIPVFGQEISGTEAVTVTEKPMNRFSVRGDLGYGVFPGLMGILIYMKVPNSFSYASGITFSGDALYNANKFIGLGLHASYQPIFHFADKDISASIEILPVIAEMQVNYSKHSYFTVGMGPGFLHGSGQSDSRSGITFFDLIAGENTGHSFNVWRGPYFMFTYSFGGQIDLSGNDKFGLDIFIRDYHIMGHEGLDNMAKVANESVGVPAFLMKMIVCAGVGMYFNF